MNIVEYPDRDLLAMGVADRLASDLENALFNRDFASFAVPGGTSPGPVFDILSAVSLDWGRVKVMLTDERWVREGHERSNTTLVKDRLLSGRAALAEFVPFVLGDDPDAAMPERSAIVAKSLPLSVVLLGMGDDMHTASLFPGAPGLEAALDPNAPALCVLRPESQPDTRVSLAAHVLDQALSKHLLITGAAKREALERARHLTVQEAPIKAVLSDMTIHWAE